jgi:hypothetical protein
MPSACQTISCHERRGRYAVHPATKSSLLRREIPALLQVSEVARPKQFKFAVRCLGTVRNSDHGGVGSHWNVPSMDVCGQCARIVRH